MRKVNILRDPEKLTLDARARAALGGTYCALSDGVTHYVLGGPANGPLAVLVQGGTAPLWIWNALAENLARHGYRVLRYDQFGRGFSDRPVRAYNRALYERQLGELTDRLDLPRPFHLVGVSLGGAIAVHFTAHHPTHVRKLVLISPLINNYKVPVLLRLPVVGELVLRLVGMRFMLNRFSDLADTVPDFETYRKRFEQQTAYKGFQRTLLSMMRSDALGNYDAAYRMVGRQRREVLLVWGRRDTEITQEMIADVCRLVPHLEFRPVPGAGHGIVLERPDLINRVVVEFLGSEDTHPANS